MVDQLISSLRDHRNQLAKVLDTVEEQNKSLLAKNVELELRVKQLEADLEEADGVYAELQQCFANHLRECEGE